VFFSLLISQGSDALGFVSIPDSGEVLASAKENKN
jgi:hypothetical protein